MNPNIPDRISYMILLQALAEKRARQLQILDELEFTELVVELMGLHASICLSADPQEPNSRYPF